MRTETIATRNLMEYVERNNGMPTREDIVNVLAMLPLFIGDVNIEIKYPKNNTSNKTKKNISKKSNDTINQLRELQSKSNKKLTIKDVKENNIDLDNLMKKYGSWRNIKKELLESPKKTYSKENNKTKRVSKKISNKKKTNTENNISVEQKLINLTNSLKRVPTREDIKGINISELVNKYGTWKNVKKELGLYDIYEKNMINEILNLRSENGKLPTIQKCRENKIDVVYFIKKYGTWKKAMEQIKNV